MFLGQANVAPMVFFLLFVFIMLLTLVTNVLMIVGLWKVFSKAGKPGWAAIIPVYSIIMLLEVAEKPVWWTIFFFIPVVNIAFWVIALVALSENFGKGGEFALGLVFLPFVFFPILGLGQAEYHPKGMDVPHEAPRCPNCRYDLTGLPVAGHCPECGRSFDKSRLGFSNRINEFEATLARVRSIVLAVLAGCMLMCGGLLQMTIWKQGLATGVFVGIIFAMASGLSFLTEKPEIIEPSRIEAPKSKPKKKFRWWFGRKQPQYDSPSDKYEDQWPLPKD